ncbi:MAG TPA: hypothetical protein VE573_09830 [Nitrososphaeraceae archaeon]|nr:hypothetical protein [Nitrososphaeraceae archaeon]
MLASNETMGEQQKENNSIILLLPSAYKSSFPSSLNIHVFTI